MIEVKHLIRYPLQAIIRLFALLHKENSLCFYIYFYHLSLISLNILHTQEIGILKHLSNRKYGFDKAR